MTNKDKYLKDGVSVEEFLNAIPRGEITAWISDYGTCISMEGLKEWLNQEVKPTLTEDEKVILKNAKGMFYIRRAKSGDLVIMTGYMENVQHEVPFYNHLFQFIQPRRRI